MFFFNRNKDKKEYYFGLFLKGDEATGFVFEMTEHHFSVLSQQTIRYTNGWENIVQDIDDILSKSEKTTRLHLKKVIFFVYSYFVENNIAEIRQPYKNIIKSISKELELQPLGYIQCNEAVAHYLEKRDKSPLNIILVELDKKNVDICIYKGSREIVSKTISRTSNFIDDITMIFNEFKAQTLLPSRLVLYDSSDLDDESVKILSHKWDKDIFIQHPRVEVIKESDLFTELGEIFAEQLHDLKNKKLTPSTEELTEAQAAYQENPLDQPEIPVSGAVLPATAEPHSPNEIMGFTISGDEDQYPQTAAPYNQIPSSQKSTPATFKKPQSPFKMKMPRISLPKVNFMKYVFLIGLLLIIISLGLIEYRFHKATLTILLPSKSISKHLDITDLDVKTATASSSVDGNSPTTGKRDIGEKAHGEVTMHNFDDSAKTFTKGTILQVDSKSFTLDQDVSIASASETLLNSEVVKQPGKTKTTITASVLGPDSNLEKGKRFKIDDQSTSQYFAINETALSGGTKKSIKTVAKKDIDDLKKTLLDKGKKQAIESTKKELPPNNRLLDTLTTVAPTNSKASKEVGEEADQIALTVQVAATYYYFDENALKDRLASELKNDVPNDFEMDTQKLSYALSKVEKKDDTIDLSVDATETASKKISEDEVVNAVKGKSKNSLDQIIKNLTSANGYTIDITSPLPFLNSFMPFIKNNITIKSTTQ